MVLPSSPSCKKNYRDQPYPNEGFRLLGAVKAWSVFKYFFPYKHLIGESWDSVLPQVLGDARSASNALEYHLAIARLVARTNDSHSQVLSKELDRYWGQMPPPFSVRWVEGRAVVVALTAEARSAKLVIGDVLLAVDGRSIQERVNELKPLLAASTPQAKEYSALLSALRGTQGSAARYQFEIAAGVKREIEFERHLSFFYRLQEKDESVFRKLDPAIGYVDLARLETSQEDAMFEAFRETKALIMDMRGYPRGTAWSIAPRPSTRTQPVTSLFRRNLVEEGEVVSRLFEQTLPGTRKQRCQIRRPNAHADRRASGEPIRTQRTDVPNPNGTQFVGQPTTGANGDITAMFVPGGIYVTFSGHDVRWPDGQQLQRIGLQPDFPVAPTIRSLRDGRDEVLEKAIAVICGRL